ncbi:MAG: hypothetical protein HY055_12470 [Magnetospirillum sp.]|nr:hypothetical protein [Magnetospirillum sp.]
MRPLPLILAAALLAPLPLAAQTGGAVPPYVAPAKVAPPLRDAEAASPAAAPLDRFKPQDDIIARFRDAYAQGGRPRLAFYWNRQLSDTLAQWYSDQRTITAEKSRNNTEGDLTIKQSGGRQSSVETQRRSADSSERAARAETWEWEFQDGFLAPFFQADAQIMDRTAITRIMGAGGEEIDPKTVEIMALQNMADLLVEVLVADSSQSTTGYELRARILDVRTGRILGMVNSRALKEWQRDDKAIATSKGFELPDEDDESFGPERADKRVKATPHGFEQKRRPPKLAVIAHNLATNVMSGMIPRLEGGAVAAPAPISAKPTPAPVPAAAPPPTIAAPAAPNQSAVPLPDVEAKPLPAPAKSAEAPAAPAADEPPMPRPTKQ